MVKLSQAKLIMAELNLAKLTMVKLSQAKIIMAKLNLDKLIMANPN